LQGIDPAELSPVPISVTSTSANGKDAGAEALLLAGTEQRLLWVRSNQYTANALDEAYNIAVRQAIRNKEKLVSFSYTPPPLKGLQVRINGVTAGKYEIQWFDPQRDNWGAVEEVDAVDGMLAIPLPEFNQDIAAKIRLIR
jgi:hypothetical protein